MQRIPCLVHDRLEELVPGLRGGREARDAMQEAELLQLLRPGNRDQFGVGHGHHDTKVRSDMGRIGCGRVQRTLRIGVDRNLQAAA